MSLEKRILAPISRDSSSPLVTRAYHSTLQIQSEQKKASHVNPMTSQKDGDHPQSQHTERATENWTANEPEAEDPRRGWVFVAEQLDHGGVSFGEFFVDLAGEYLDSYSTLAVFTDRASAVAYAIKAAREWNAKIDPSVFDS